MSQASPALLPFRIIPAGHVFLPKFSKILSKLNTDPSTSFRPIGLNFAQDDMVLNSELHF